MNKLSSQSLILKPKNRFSIIAVMLGAGLCLGLTAPASASPADSATAADIKAKTVMGEANAEATPEADPIKACGPAPKDKDSSAWGKYFEVNNVNIRRAPNKDSRICAQGQKSHKADYHCYTVRDGRTWTYLRDVKTHYAGWVRDDLLKGRGSLVRC